MKKLSKILILLALSSSFASTVVADSYSPNQPPNGDSYFDNSMASAPSEREYHPEDYNGGSNTYNPGQIAQGGGGGGQPNWNQPNMSQQNWNQPNRSQRNWNQQNWSQPDEYGSYGGYTSPEARAQGYQRMQGSLQPGQYRRYPMNAEESQLQQQYYNR